MRVLVLDGLASLKLSSKAQRQLLAAAALLLNLEVLSVRGCGLDRLDALRLPALLRCHLDGNKLSAAKHLVEFVAHSTRLEHLSLQGNPLASGTEWQVGRVSSHTPLLFQCLPLPIFIVS